jgi:hypothetical protein
VSCAGLPLSEAGHHRTTESEWPPGIALAPVSEVGPPYRGHDSPGSSSAFPRHLRERQGTVEHQPHWSVSQFPFGYRARMRRRCGETCARDSDPQECFLGPGKDFHRDLQ